MVFTVTLRKIEHTEIEYIGEDLPDVRQQAITGTPAGHELIQCHVHPSPDSKKKTTAIYERVDITQTITGESRAEILAQKPDGWRIVHSIQS